MNLTTIAALLLAWQLLSSQTHREQPHKPDLTQIFSNETNNVIDCVGKLSSDKATGEDKMGALFQIVSNPTVMNLVGNLFQQDGAKKNDDNAGARSDRSGASGNFDNADSRQAGGTNIEENTHGGAENAFTNEEGYRFDTPSAASQEFFRPINNIADAEVKNKLYWFYDNWYIK